MNEGINSKTISKGINIGNYIKAYVNLNSNNSNLHLVINTNTGYQDVRLPIIITMDLLSGKTNSNLNWKVVEQTKEEGKPETILVTGWDNKTYTLTKNDDTKVYTDETKTITLEKMYLKELNKTTFDSYQITDQLGVTYRVHKDNFQITKIKYQSQDVEATKDGGYYTFVLNKTELSIGIDNIGIGRVFTKENGQSISNNIIEWNSDKTLRYLEIYKTDNKPDLEKTPIEYYRFTFDNTNKKIVISDETNSIKYTFIFDANKIVTKYLKTKGNETLHEIIFNYENIGQKYHETRMIENNNETLFYFNNDNLILTKTKDNIVTKYCYDETNYNVITIDRSDFNNYSSSEYNLLTRKQSWTPSNPINVVTLNTLIPTFSLRNAATAPYVLKGTFDNIEKGTYTLSGIVEYTILSSYQVGVKSPLNISFKFKKGTKEITSFVLTWDKNDASTKKEIYLLEKIELKDSIDNIEITFDAPDLKPLSLKHLCLNKFSNLVEYFYDEDGNVQYARQHLIKDNYQDIDFYKVSEVLNYSDDPYLISNNVINEVANNKNYKVINTNEYGLINEKKYVNDKLVTQSIKANNLKMEKSYSYSDNFIASITDESNYNVKYTYYKSYNVINTTSDNTTQITNKYNDNYELLESLSLGNINNSINKSINYEYDSKQRISKITCDNNQVYYFNYEGDNLKEILLKNLTNNTTRSLIKYNYQKMSDYQYYLIGKSYSNEKYVYDYKDGNLISIGVEDINTGVKTALLSMNYDEHNRINSIHDSLIDDTYEYTYDINGNLLKVISNNLEEVNIIDEDNNLIRKTIKNNEYKIMEETFSSHKLNANKKAKIQKLKYDVNNTNNDYYCFFDEGNANLISSVYDSSNNIIRIKRKETMPIIINNADTSKNTLVPEIKVINNVPTIGNFKNAAFGCTYQFKLEEALEGTVSFWFKVESDNNKEHFLFSLGQNSSQDNITIKIKHQNQIGVVNKVPILVSEGYVLYHDYSAFNTNSWNFITLNWKLKNESGNKYLIEKCDLIVNGAIKSFPSNQFSNKHYISLKSTMPVNLTVGGVLDCASNYLLKNKDNNNEGIYNEYQISNDYGYAVLENSSDKLLTISALTIHLGSIKTQKEITNYQNKTAFVVKEDEPYYGSNLNKVIDNIYLNYDELKSATNNENNKIIVYPLHNSLMTIDGNDTLNVLANNNYQKKNSYLLTYDDIFNTNHLILTPGVFVYKQISFNSGTVAAKVKIKNNTNKPQAIFDFRSNLYLEQIEDGIMTLQSYKGKLYLSYWPTDNGVLIDLGSISEGIHNIAIAFQRAVNSEYQTAFDYTIKVMVDNNIQTQYIQQYTGIEQVYCFIGNSPIISFEPLSEGLENFVYTTAFSSDDTLHNLINSNNCIQKIDIYNAIGLLTSSDIKYGSFNLSNQYIYAKNNGNTLLKISNQIINYGSNHKTLEYSYDFKGRITSKEDLFNVTNYTYNIDDTLKKEEITNNKTIEYSYDSNNNITEIDESSGLKTNFFYEDSINKDLLTRYKTNNGLEHYISYDNDGLPIKTYEINAETSNINDIYLYEWTNRRLTKYVDKLNTQTFTFTYDAQGRRIKKIVKTGSSRRTIITDYYYDANNRLILEKNEQLGKLYKYYYDSVGALISIEINGVMLYYIRDIANNIIGLVDSNNQLVAKYSYDAFGNVLTKEGTYATKNPFLYKGYYYEHSIQLYYLESRYYDPYIRRFISPDNIDYLEPTSFNGLNLYACCGNDPVNYSLYSLANSEAYNLNIKKYDSSLLKKVKNYDIIKNNFAKFTFQSAIMIHNTHNILNNIYFGNLFGNVSITTTKQLNDAGLFYFFSDYGNDNTGIGLNMNFTSWYGIGIHITSDIGFGTYFQLGNLTYGADISLLNGISFNVGLISDDKTISYSLNVGWGTIGLCALGVGIIMQMPGINLVAASLLIISIIVKINNQKGVKRLS